MRGLIVLVCLSVGLTAQVQKEPVHEGKPLSEWVRLLKDKDSVKRGSITSTGRGATGWGGPASSTVGSPPGCHSGSAPTSS